MADSKEEQVDNLYQILLQRNLLNIEAIKGFVKKASSPISLKKQQKQLTHKDNTHLVNSTPKKLSRGKYSSLENARTKESETKIALLCGNQQNESDCIQQRIERRTNIKFNHYKYSLPNKNKQVQKISSNKIQILRAQTDMTIFDENSLSKERVLRPAHRTWKTQSQKAILNFRQIVFPNSQKQQAPSRMSDYNSLKKNLENKQTIIISKESGLNNLSNLCDEIIKSKKMRDTRSFLPNIKKANELKQQLAVMFLKEKQNLQNNSNKNKLKLEAIPIYNIDWNSNDS